MSKELELIAAAMRDVATEGHNGAPGARDDGQLWGAFPNTMTVHDLAAHVVSRLSDAGYSIVPSEMKSTQWLRVLTKDGSLWCETSDEDEANAAASAISQPVQRLYRSSAPSEWRTLAGDASATTKAGES